jgi:hypothetical protein
VDNFPFGLYYVDLYDRYAKIRRTIRHCLAVYPHNDAYKKALLDMEQFIWRLMRKWKRITGCSKMNEWILYRAPMGIYMFNLIGKNAPLKILGFDTDLAKMLSSVSYATYKKCMDEYEMRKEDDRIRKRGNHDLDSVLEEIERMNKVLSSIGSVV